MTDADAPPKPGRYGSNFLGDDLGDEMSVARVALSTNAGLNRQPTAMSRALRSAEAGRRWLRGLRRSLVRVSLLSIPSGATNLYCLGTSRKSLK
jgi:hypothetical protein